MSGDWQSRQFFEECIDQYADSIYRVAFRLTGNRDHADELTQETYLNAWKNIDSLNDPAKLRSWMFAILRNQYTKMLRRLPKTNLVAIPLEELAVVQPRGHDQSELVQSALARLSDEHRLPLLLVTMEGMTVEEVAETLGIPRGTVLSRLHRGREKLRRWLGP